MEKWEYQIIPCNIEIVVGEAWKQRTELQSQNRANISLTAVAFGSKHKFVKDLIKESHYYTMFG